MVIYRPYMLPTGSLQSFPGEFKQHNKRQLEKQEYLKEHTIMNELTKRKYLPKKNSKRPTTRKNEWFVKLLIILMSVYLDGCARTTL